ncbi:hypothetical protein K7X08_029625 [Anisodus acutangulus]|uniref:MLO-like protein n=1 Tax=Anisodus acutangulus TaxID=402998 RepID=A0A9Q1QT23_9SOLA|nr:hypothetical protein K7X08_029625 [Anisodus acutangulus]
MGGGGEDEGEGSLEFTPTWVVAAHLKKKKQKHLYEALQKVKEELMLLGFISLLLTVFQSRIVKFCVPPCVVTHLLPCSLSLGGNSSSSHEEPHASNQSVHYHAGSHHHRHLLAEEMTAEGYCHKKHKVLLLSLEALHHLHIFIFVLAIVHVTFTVLTIVFGGAKIRQWKYWEDAIVKDNPDSEHDHLRPAVTHVHEHDFIRNRFQGISKQSAILGWVHSFFKQFYASTHCRGNPRFNFHRYMIRALEDDFRTVVGIRQILVILFLLLNINGKLTNHYAFACWHMYFWITFIPFIMSDPIKNFTCLLLAVDTKLEHVIMQLAHEIAEKHVAVGACNSYQVHHSIQFFQYGFYSCIMRKYVFVIPRLVIGVFIQVLCSYSTLPLYALVTQMGSHYKKSMFDDHVQACLLDWAEKVKRKKGHKAATDGSSHSTEGSSLGSPMSVNGHKESQTGV